MASDDYKISLAMYKKKIMFPHFGESTLSNFGDNSVSHNIIQMTGYDYIKLSSINKEALKKISVIREARTEYYL